MASKSGASKDTDLSANSSSPFQRLFKKPRGSQIEVEENPLPALTDSKMDSYPIEKELRGSDSGSGTSIGAGRQVQGEVFAEGGQSRFYEPIATFEGRHRWDPHAEWTEQEETRLIRRVSTHFSLAFSLKDEKDLHSIYRS